MPLPPEFGTSDTASDNNGINCLPLGDFTRWDLEWGLFHVRTGVKDQMYHEHTAHCRDCGQA